MAQESDKDLERPSARNSGDLVVTRESFARELRRAPAPMAGVPRSRPDETALDLHRYWEVIRGRWRMVATIFSLTVAAVAVGTYLQTPVYRAGGTIEIRKQGTEGVPVQELFQLERISDQYLETQYGLLRSPALARRVVADLNLVAVREFNSTEQPGVEGREQKATDGSGSSTAVDQVVSRFQKRLIIDPIKGSRLVKVSFESEDPQLAARAVNSVFENYMAMRMETSRAAVDQLSKQADSVRARLTQSEAHLQEYALNNELQLIDNGAGESENIVHERLRRLQQQLTEAEAERYAKEAQYSLVQRGTPDYLGSELLRSLSSRSADLRSEYAKLRVTFTDDYPRTKQVKNQLDTLEALIANERGRIATEITNDYVAAQRRQELLRNAFERQKALTDRLAGKTAEYQVLKRDVEGHQQLYTVLQQKQKEAEVSAALAATEFAIVDEAVPPQDPIRPLPARNLQLAVIVGLILGLGVAFLREFTDTTVRTLEEIDVLSDRPVLAMIPSLATATTNQDRSSLAEAFSTLRTSILLQVGPSAPRSLLITSTQPREGKTTTSVNLALSMAKLGRRVLLVDADLRCPAVHRAFNLRNQTGLADYLAGSAEWHEIVERHVVPGLHIMPAGKPPMNPAELLSSDRMSRFVETTSAVYDFVIFDSPALSINAADTHILSPLIDGVIMVLRSRTTPRDAAQRALKQVPNLLGVVLNDLDARQFQAYYQDYQSAPDETAHIPRRLA